MTDPRREPAPADAASPDAASMDAAAPPPGAAPVPVMIESDPPVDPGDRALFGVIDRLAAILDHSDLVELEIQVGDTGLTLRKPIALAQPVAVTGAGGAAPGSPGSGPAGSLPSGSAGSAGAGAPPAVETAPARPSVKAPLTGIWYGSPAPGSAPYVQVGSEIAAGTVIGLIEAMKLFNEIKSDLAGRVVKVNAENGKLVKAKQPLIEVEPL